MRLKITVEIEGQHDLDDMLDEGKVAQLLGCTRSALTQARKAGGGRCPPYSIQGANSPMYRLRDVLAWAQVHARVIGRTRMSPAPKKRRKRKLPKNTTVITGVFAGGRRF